MSEYATVDLLIETIDEEPGGPLTKEGVELVRKCWEHGRASVQPEITTLRQQLADAKKENERVRQANLHTMDVFEDMKAAKEKAEARVAELEQGSLQAIANKVCGELPEGWVINLCMENGAAWVEAIKPSGYTIDIDRADLTMAEQVIEALKQAAGAEQ